MNLCFSTLGCCEKSIDEIIRLANSFDIKQLELRGVGGLLDNLNIEAFSEQNANNTKNKLSLHGITPVVLGTSCSFHNADRIESSIAEAKANVDVAARLGIKYIRVFGDRKTDEEASVRIISAISQICEYSKSVSVLLETHGDFNDEKSLSPITDALCCHNNFGLIWDIEHTHKIYSDNWSDFYSFAGPYIKHIHIKDYSDTKGALTDIGAGDVPIRQIVERLTLDGYNGCLSLEWEKKWHPELSDINQALSDFLRIVK